MNNHNTKTKTVPCRNHSNKNVDNDVPKKMTPLGAVVRLKDDKGNKQDFLVAELVAKTFLPMPNDGKKYKLMRIDGNILNDRADNLKWVEDDNC